MKENEIAITTSEAIDLALPPSSLDPVLHYVEGLKSPMSRRTMLEGLKRCVRVMYGDGRAVESVPWAQLDYARTNVIRARLIAGFSPRTVGVTLSALRGVLHSCKRLDLMTHVAYLSATDWEGPGISSRMPAGRDLSAAELERLVAFCFAQEGAYGAYLRVVFALLFGAGLRATEACRCLSKGFLREEGALRFIGKRDKEAQVPLNEGEIVALEGWFPVRETLAPSVPWLLVRIDAQQVTPSVLGHLCLEIAEKSGIARFTPHDCRRTLATRLLEAGVDLATVQRILRHDSPATTTLYDKRSRTLDAEARRRVVIWGTK